MSSLEISYVIPFHSDIDRLFETVNLLRKNKSKYRIKEVLLCHNGKSLNRLIEKQIQDHLEPDQEKLFHTDDAGIGAGYRLGLEKASGNFVILSASDLPFGFTDIEALLSLNDPLRTEMAIGSKGHSQSFIKDHGLRRRIASAIFYWIRRVLLGRLTPKDSQGTFLGQRDIFSQLLPLAKSNDYLFSLELATLYTRKFRRPVVELPVKLLNDGGTSSVGIFRDGIRLIRGILALRSQQQN